MRMVPALGRSAWRRLRFHCNTGRNWLKFKNLELADCRERQRRIVGMTENRLSATTIRQIEFELEKAERGMAMPYDAERVMQLRSMLREARKQKLSAGLRERREKS